MASERSKISTGKLNLKQFASAVPRTTYYSLYNRIHSRIDAVDSTVKWYRTYFRQWKIELGTLQF